MLRTVVELGDPLHPLGADVDFGVAAVHVEPADGVVELPHPGVANEEDVVGAAVEPVESEAPLAVSETKVKLNLRCSFSICHIKDIVFLLRK